MTNAMVSSAAASLPPSTVALSAAYSTTVNTAGPLSMPSPASSSTGHSPRMQDIIPGQCQLSAHGVCTCGVGHRTVTSRLQHRSGLIHIFLTLVIPSLFVYSATGVSPSILP